MCKGNESAQGRLDSQSAVCEMACFFFLSRAWSMEVPTWYTVGGYLPYLPFWEIRRFRDSSGRCDRQAQMLVAGEMGKIH